MGHYLASWRDFDPAARRLIHLGFGVLVLIFIYCVLGMASAPKEAIVYLRNIAGPYLLLQICVIVGARYGSAAARPLAAVGILLLVYGYGELLLRESLFDLINASDYLAMRTREASDAGQWVKLMQETGRVIRDFEDTQKITLFNTPLLDLNLEFYRMMGPNFHAISYAYALAFFSLAALARGRIGYGLAALPLLIVIGSKGALVLLVLTAAFVGLSRAVPMRGLFFLFCGILAVYAAATIVIGRAIGDYHVIGLMGGLEGFLHNPAGRGLGVGGNLSINMAVMDWSRSQALGRTETAVESAIGVLLYQMGVAGLALCAANIWLAWTAWRRFLRTRRADAAVVAFALLAITANGLFQEEALFAPLAIGAMMALAGLVLAAPGEPAWVRPVPRPAPIGVLA
jgi:hypothetical protein